MKTTRPTTGILCPECGKLFQKESYLLKRNSKLGINTFCSRTCNGKYNARNNPALLAYSNSEENKERLKLLCSSTRDQYTDFRYYIRNAVKQKHTVNVTLQYLKNLWEQQNGTCPYTGLKLIHQNLRTSIDKDNPYIYASLDRIDSSLGYIQNNVEFVSLGIQLLKNKYSKNCVLEFLKNIQ